MKKETCSTCNGVGVISRVCPTCQGSPSKLDDDCPTCDNDGYVETECPDCKGTGEIGEDEDD